MPVFPSRPWMEEFCERFVAHPQADEVAASLDGVYRFVIDPSGPLPERHSYDVAIRPTGAGAQATVLPGDSGDDPRLTVSADYDRWRQLILGELDIGMAVLLRRVRVSGDMSGVASRLSSAQPLMQTLSSVDTQWPQG